MMASFANLIGMKKLSPPLLSLSLWAFLNCKKPFAVSWHGSGLFSFFCACITPSSLAFFEQLPKRFKMHRIGLEMAGPTSVRVCKLISAFLHNSRALFQIAEVGGPRNIWDGEGVVWCKLLSY